jgi:hypothetical protein
MLRSVLYLPKTVAGSPGRLLQVRDLVAGRRDDVGVAAGVDAELVPRRRGQDLDARGLLHLLLDALVLEPLPDRVRRMTMLTTPSASWASPAA